MISKVSLVVLCSVIVTRADLVPYTLGGTTIMVDSEVLKYSSPLLAHIQNGMPHRRDSNEQSQSSETETDLQTNKYGLSNSGISAIHEEQGGQENDHKFKLQNDFKKDPEGHLDISVLDEGQAVYPYRGQTLYPSTFSRPKPITWEDAAGIYLGQDKIPLESVQNSQPSLYYSVENPDESHVSQTIHKIVSSLNENTADVKLNDRAPVPIVPPIPGAQSFVNSGQQQQQSEDPSNTFNDDSDLQPDTNTISILSESQGDGNVENVPTESQVASNDDSFNIFNTQDSIDPITTLGNFQTEANFDVHINMDQDVHSDDGDQFEQTNTEETISINPLNSNDEVIFTDQPDGDVITEASTDDTATEIPLEEILEKKEEELALLALQNEQIIKEEQEHQEALEQAMANMFDSLFTPSQSESEKENESGLEANTDSTVANDDPFASEKDASGTGTDEEKDKNSEIDSAIPQEPPTRDEASVLSTSEGEQEPELPQNEEVQLQELDKEQNVQGISGSTNDDNEAINPVENQVNEQSEASKDENGHLMPEQDTSSDAVEKFTEDTPNKPNEESHVQQDITSQDENVDLNPNNNQDNQGILEVTPSEDALPQNTNNDGQNDHIEDVSAQNDNQNSGSHNTDDSIHTDFPNTRGDPAKTTAETFHYSSVLKNPLPITADQAAGIYINDEKVFNKQNPDPPPGYSTRHDSPVDDSGLLTWYGQDPISIFDPMQLNKPEDTPVKEAPDHSIRTPQNPSDNEIPNGRPTIPGHVPKPRPATDDPQLDENEEEDAGVSGNVTNRHPGAVFHSAQPDLLAKSTCQCGMRFSPTKIVGGTETDIEEFPWMVGLATKVDDFIYCGGALLNDLYILTAAHCVHGQYPEDIYVRLGSTRRDSSNFVNIDVDKFIIHPKYDINVVYKADIALIKLEKPVEAFTDKIFPVCLPQGKDSFAGLDAIVSGWGRNNFGGDVTQGLMEASVSIMSTKKCRKNSFYQRHEVHKKIMCARADGIDACQGDSGGPLVILDGNQYKHIGIVSWGIGCAQEKYPGIYTRTSSYNKWIMANLKGGVGCRQGKKNKKKKNKNRKKNKFPLATTLRRRNKNKNRKDDDDDESDKKDNRRNQNDKPKDDNDDESNKNKRKNQNNKIKVQDQTNQRDNPKKPNRQKNDGLMNILSGLLGGSQNAKDEIDQDSDDVSQKNDKPVTISQDGEDKEGDQTTSNADKHRGGGSRPSGNKKRKNKNKNRNSDNDSQPNKGNKNNRNNKNKERNDDDERRPSRGNQQKRRNKNKGRTDIDESESPIDNQQAHRLEEIELSEPVETQLSVSKKNKKRKRNKNREHKNGDADDEDDTDILTTEVTRNRDTHRVRDQNKHKDDEDGEELSDQQSELDWGDLSQALMGIGDIIANENHQERDTTT